MNGSGTLFAVGLPSKKILNRSDLTSPKSSGKENRYNRETFQMEPCG